MEYSDLYESKKNAHKLQMAKVKYMQSRLNYDDRIFRMTSVVEIIDATHFYLTFDNILKFLLLTT